MKKIFVSFCLYCLSFAVIASVKLQVSPGQQKPVTLSRLHLNRIITPFLAPQVRTIDEAEIRIKNSVIYLSSQQEEPFVVYITPHDNEAHALSLLVTLLDVPPREIQLTLSKQWQKKLHNHREAAKRFEEAGDYQYTITEVLSSLVKGQIPEGYELGKPGKNSSQPCQQDGLIFNFTTGQQIEGHHFSILVGTAQNITEKPLTFYEYSCHSQNVSAVSMWPKNKLYPGQRRELFILFNVSASESDPVVRPSLLNY